MDNELSANNYFHCIQKKSWICCLDGKVLQSGGCPKASFKGVGKNSIILDGDEKLFDEYGQFDQEKANLVYNQHTHNKIFDAELGIDNYYKFSKKLISDKAMGKKTRILCMSFRKVVKNTQQAVSIDEVGKHKRNNYIKMQYCIKNINLL